MLFFLLRRFQNSLNKSNLKTKQTFNKQYDEIQSQLWNECLVRLTLMYIFHFQNHLFFVLGKAHHQSFLYSTCRTYVCADSLYRLFYEYSSSFIKIIVWSSLTRTTFCDVLWLDQFSLSYVAYVVSLTPRKSCFRDESIFVLLILYSE